MRPRLLFFIALTVVTLTTGPVVVSAVSDENGGRVGFGRNTSGGYGGKVIAVTNLNDSGPGSLRAAVEASGRRTVVFRVAGTIHLTSTIVANDPFLTINGATARSPGIEIRGGALMVRTHDVIIRHLRLRPGDRTDAPAETDALTLNGAGGSPVYNVFINHVTMLWGADVGGLAVLGDVHDVTVQNSIMGEGLYLSAHPEGTLAQGGHSYAANVTQMDSSLAAPRRLTFWRNLFTTSDERMPRFQGAECIDVINNVIYNWGTKAAYGNPRSLNLVNNWYRRGPETNRELFWELQTSDVTPRAFSGAVYVSGNVADGISGGRGGPDTIYAASPRCGGLSVSPGPAAAAYDAVLANVGATRPARDTVDRRVVSNVVNRTGEFFNGLGFPYPNPYWPY